MMKVDRPRWHAQAACRGRVDLFFPEHGGRDAYTEARKLCAGCPVQTECIEWAATNLDGRSWGENGMWGGVAPRDRRIRLRTLRRQLFTGHTPDESDERHGDEAGFVAHRRRGELACDACRLGHADYNAELNRRRRVGLPVRTGPRLHEALG